MPLIYPTAPAGTHDCRLEYISTTEIRLVRYGGSQIMINGTLYTIPVNGVSAAPPANITASLWFNVYVTATGGVLSLYLEATDFVIDAASGMPILPGNPNYTLVGMITGSLSTFQNSDVVCGYISYWNRKQRMVRVSNSQATTAGPWTPLNNFGMGFLAFNGDGVSVMYSGYEYGDTGGQTLYNSVHISFWNGSNEVSIDPGCYSYSAYANWTFNVGMVTDWVATAPQLYQAKLFGGIGGGGTGTWVLQGGVLFDG